MIEHNSEVYNHPYRDLLPYIYTCTMKKDIYVGVIVYFTVMFDHPSCFLTFCRSGISTSCYIFNVFYLLVRGATALLVAAVNSLGPKFISLGHFPSIEHLNIP